MRKFGVKRLLIYPPRCRPKSGHVWDVKKQRSECIKFSLCTVWHIPMVEVGFSCISPPLGGGKHHQCFRIQPLKNVT